MSLPIRTKIPTNVASSLINNRAGISVQRTEILPNLRVGSGQISSDLRIQANTVGDNSSEQSVSLRLIMSDRPGAVSESDTPTVLYLPFFL